MRLWTGILLLGGLLAGSALGAQAVERGDAERGRAIFNGKGICYYCHGMDGDWDRRPQLSEETTKVIARLTPNTPDLRDSRSLRLKSDREGSARSGRGTREPACCPMRP